MPAAGTVLPWTTWAWTTYHTILKSSPLLGDANNVFTWFENGKDFEYSTP